MLSSQCSRTWQEQWQHWQYHWDALHTRQVSLGAEAWERLRATSTEEPRRVRGTSGKTHECPCSQSWQRSELCQSHLSWHTGAGWCQQQGHAPWHSFYYCWWCKCCCCPHSDQWLPTPASVAAELGPSLMAPCHLERFGAWHFGSRVTEGIFTPLSAIIHIHSK